MSQPREPVSLRANYLRSLANQAVQVGAVAVIMILVARALGPEGKGVVAVVVALSTMLAAATLLSLPTATTYFLAGRHAPPGRLAANALAFLVVVGVAVPAAAWMLRGAGLRLLPVLGGPGMWLLVIALVPPAYVVEFASAFLVAERRFDRLTYANAAVGLVFVGMFAGLLLLDSATVTGALVLFLAYRIARATALCTVVSWPPRATLAFDARVLRATAGYSLQGHLGVVVQAVVYRIDLLLVSAYLGAGAAGIYAAATLLVQFLGHAPSAFGMVVFPEVAAADDTSGRHVVTRISRQTLWSTATAAVLLALAAPVLVPAVYGAAFAPAVAPLWWLTPGAVMLALARVVVPAISAMGRPWVGSVGAALALTLTVAGNVLLIPRLGVTGAALASSTAYAAQCVFIVAMYRQFSRAPLRELFAFRPQDYRALGGVLRRAGIT